MNRIFERGILPAAVVPSAAEAVPLARALLAGGLDVMEVTFRNADAPRCVELIRKEVPEMQIGAGTLLTAAQIQQAIDAGAQFGVTPGFNPTVIEAARARNFPLIPGVMTPGEMERALEMGCPTVKFFPAEAAGGVNYLKAVAAPYAHTALRVIPLGGIGPTNLQPYLALPIVAAIGGSWMASRELAAAHDWPRITALAQEALAMTMVALQSRER
jgi:2-dehydro-3-deoxyphosphogluconate aldolase / (4S)-4-hydroxy-2-oxoglutarate aldolase